MATKNITSSLPLSGGTLSGNLYTSTDYTPTSYLNLVNKLYSDNVQAYAASMSSTASDVLSATSTVLYITPPVQYNHKASCKAWAARDLYTTGYYYYGITSVTSLANRVYRVNFTTAFPNTNYSVYVTKGNNGSTTQFAMVSTKTTTYVDIQFLKNDGTLVTAGTLYNDIAVAVYGEY